MAKISKEPAVGISEEKRKEMLASVGYNLKKSKNTDELYTVKKGKKRKPQDHIQKAVEGKREIC